MGCPPRGRKREKRMRSGSDQGEEARVWSNRIYVYKNYISLLGVVFMVVFSSFLGYCAWSEWHRGEFLTPSVLIAVTLLLVWFGVYFLIYGFDLVIDRDGINSVLLGNTTRLPWNGISKITLSAGPVVGDAKSMDVFRVHQVVDGKEKVVLRFNDYVLSGTERLEDVVGHLARENGIVFVNERS